MSLLCPRSPSVHARSKRGVLLLLAAIALLPSFGSAFAYEGFTVGVLGGVPGGGAYVINIHAVQPLAEVDLDDNPLKFSARASLSTSLSLRAPPAVAVAALANSAEGRVGRYLGVGTGLSFPGISSGRPLWSIYGLAGFRFPLATRLHGVLELQLSSNRLVTAPNLGVAIEYTLGGRQ